MRFLIVLVCFLLSSFASAQILPDSHDFDKKGRHKKNCERCRGEKILHEARWQPNSFPGSVQLVKAPVEGEKWTPDVPDDTGLSGKEILALLALADAIAAVDKSLKDVAEQPTPKIAILWLRGSFLSCDMRPMTPKEIEEQNSDVLAMHHHIRELRAITTRIQSQVAKSRKAGPMEHEPFPIVPNDIDHPSERKIIEKEPPVVIEDKPGTEAFNN